MYCTPENLYTYLPGIDSDNENLPRDTFLLPLVESVGHKMNALLSSKYVVPITENKSPESFSILRLIAIDLCREKVAQRLNYQTYNTETNQVAPWMMAVKKAEKQLQEIRAGEFPLPDAVPCGTDCEAFDVGYYDTSCIPGRSKQELELPDGSRQRRGIT